MQVLYVTEFDVERSDAAPPYEGVLASVGRWLSYLTRSDFDVARLGRSGESELASDARGGSRTASWEVVGTAQSSALRLSVLDHDEETGGTFLTRVTVGHVEERTTLRVSMAREVPTTWLSPASPADLRQPGVFRHVLADAGNRLKLRGQVQDGRDVSVRTGLEIQELARAIRTDTRLPLVLVHTRGLTAGAAARIAASKLVGLARVVTLDLAAARRLEALLPGYAPAYAGATLVWSDHRVPAQRISGGVVNAPDRDLLRAWLMRRIAPVSVLSRGLDVAYRAARRAELDERQAIAQQRIEMATKSGDLAAQLDAVRSELSEAVETASAWEELATANDEVVDRLQQKTARIPELERENEDLQDRVEQLTLALGAAARGESPVIEDVEDDPWGGLPQLVQGSKESAEDLFLHLKDATGGTIVFTKRAITSWKKSNYPYPDEMAEKLIRLARASVALYSVADQTFSHLDQWFHEEHDLRVAMSDDTIKKTRSLRFFEFEGVTYDRTPHVKVRDAAPRQHVGRIHFALDSERQRIVVDHVATKLY